MLRRFLPSSRNRLLVYLSAVVGPTLVVLTLGAMAAVRQMGALDALRLTTERLEEARIAAELERVITSQASAALTDSALDRLAKASAAGDPAVVDRQRGELVAFKARHRIASLIFVEGGGELRYPRVNPSLPQTLEELVGLEPVARRIRIASLIARAKAREEQKAFRQAADAYAQVERLATAARLRGVVAAARAFAVERTGDASAAIDAYRSVADKYGDTYSLADRPHALLAAQALVRLGEVADLRVAAVHRDLLAGRWSVTSDQAKYFLGLITRSEVSAVSSPFIAELATARTLGMQFHPAPALEPGRPLMAAVGDERDPLQVAYRATAGEGVVGIVIDLEWVRGTVLPDVVHSVAAERRVEIGPLSAEHAGFRTMLPEWRVGIMPPAVARASWLRADFAAFAATIVVVLGVLVMGVVLLMRDVHRETTVNRLRADLVGGVSHELKTPLSVIRLYAETLDEVQDATASDRHRFTQAIVQETERLRRLIDGVIDFSKIQQGERTYTMTTGSLVPVVTRVVERFRDYLALHDFTLTAAIAPAVPDVVFDDLAVEQAVLNLLDNAFKYSGESTELNVRLARHDGAVIVEVQDHGIGIDGSEQARIFDRFHRGMHPDRGGYGLGLYLVHHIMEAHGGHVELKSAAGRGSMFRLVFPIAIQVTESVVTGHSSEVSHAEGAARRG